MPVHIGKLIQAEVENKRLTYREFGALINKNEKTVPNIYDRATMSIDLLVTISEALQKDFLSVYYEEEPMKSLRVDEIVKLNNQLQKLIEENKQLQRELALTQSLSESQKETITFAKEQIDEYKLKLKDLLAKVAAHDPENKTHNAPAGKG
jgi:regulator of replication initiation timing